MYLLLRGLKSCMLLCIYIREEMAKEMQFLLEADGRKFLFGGWITSVSG